MPTAVLILSQTSGRGSTEPTIWLRAPSLCSHAWTIAAKSLSTDIMVSACARSSASRVPRAYSAASAIWSSLRPSSKSRHSRIPSCCGAAMFHRIYRRLELRRQLLAAPAVVIGEQHELLPIRLQTANALQSRFNFWRSPGAPAGPGPIGGRLPWLSAPLRSRPRRACARRRWPGFGQWMPST